MGPLTPEELAAPGWRTWPKERLTATIEALSRRLTVANAVISGHKAEIDTLRSVVLRLSRGWHVMGDKAGDWWAHPHVDDYPPRNRVTADEADAIRRALVVPAADTATQDNSPEAMRARRGGTPCDCPTLRNVGAGWYCGVHGYQDVPAADTATQDRS